MQLLLTVESWHILCLNISQFLKNILTSVYLRRLVSFVKANFIFFMLNVEMKRRQKMFVSFLLVKAEDMVKSFPFTFPRWLLNGYCIVHYNVITLQCAPMKDHACF